MARRFLCVLVNKFPCLRDRLIGSGSVIVQVSIVSLNFNDFHSNGTIFARAPDW